jgi:hypothetical protein
MTIQTRIADLVPNPTVLSNVIVKNFRAKNSLISSGVAVTGPEVDLLMSGGSATQGLSFVNKVDTSTFNYGSDDFDEKGPTGKITASNYMALRHDLNWGWAYTDLVKIITKYDVRAGLTSAIPLYWSEVGENIAIASMKGALAKTAALTTGAVTDTFDLKSIVSVSATMDDPRSRKTLFMSNKTFAKLQLSNIGTVGVQASDAQLNVQTYAGYNVVLTEAFGDQMTLVAQEGAIAFSAGLVPFEVGAEICRDGNAGNGQGGEILRTRLSIVAAPQGFSYTGAAKPGLAGLALPANWTQSETDNRYIGFRAIKHAA